MMNNIIRFGLQFAINIIKVMIITWIIDGVIGKLEKRWDARRIKKANKRFEDHIKGGN